jgi:SAM-dependent methyltransferase/uncharacterized membrane protein YbhN (UPF0104 family)
MGSIPAPPNSVEQRFRGSRIVSAVTVALGVCMLVAFFVTSLEPLDQRALSERPPAGLVLALSGATAAHLMTRFFRWQFLLRAAGAYIPIRRSAHIFFASLSLSWTPLYLGEMLFKIVFVRRYGASTTAGTAVAFAERLCDGAALLLITAGAGLWTGAPAPALLTICVLVFAGQVRTWLASAIARPLAASEQLAGLNVKPAKSAVRGLARRDVVAPALVLSIGAWLPPALSLWLAIEAFGGAVPIASAIELYGTRMLSGAFAFHNVAPGATRAGMLSGLALLDLSETTATNAVVALQILTFGAAILVGFAVLTWVAWHGELAEVGTQAHFDGLADTYDAEIPVYLRDHLVRKKVVFSIPHLRDEMTFGLDIGCGRGYYLEQFREHGLRMVGVDISLRQLNAEACVGRAAAADVLHLPFADAVFDFAYCVNVLHHVTPGELQERALTEIRRVLRPGGRFFLHEINVTNPVFRFYISYLFPLLRNIDIGNERWLRPESVGSLPGWHLDKVEYFTFVPDFLPHFVTPWAWKIERRIEQSRFAHLGAHFLAVLTAQ